MTRVDRKAPGWLAVRMIRPEVRERALRVSPLRFSGLPPREFALAVVARYALQHGHWVPAAGLSVLLRLEREGHAGVVNAPVATSDSR